MERDRELFTPRPPRLNGAGHRPRIYVPGHNLQKLLLLLNVVAAVSGDSPVSVSGFLGEQVVLPCTYKGNAPVSDLLVIWETAKGEILQKFITGNNDLTEQDPRFRNRTNLFKDQLGQGNWSVLISDLRESDQNQYLCDIHKRIAVGYITEQTDIIHLSVTGDWSVSGFLGEQIVLPCSYKGNVPVSDLQVIWGISRSEILHKFVDGNDDLTEQDPRFRNRTKLFKDQLEQGNWSILISDLRKSDKKMYECQIYKKKEEVHYLVKSDVVHLFVLERPETPVPTMSVPGVRSGFGFGIGVGVAVSFFAGVLLSGIVFCVFQRRPKWNCVQNRHSNNRNEGPNDVPLTGVSCPGEAWGLVTTAPEHQDGVAGEENLLGNGTLQH
ncbi:matrix remodeling-associated protein 8-like isoform X1 [Carcharodon carcharias]|uniref:matrix remodeling-associated protein 8-like isoform X1 n=1 Tax=Carcharodon carcharias TaxID=13397 RepID=UPI001B7F0AAE|nr:matrix remodeling-associated protein 8-like isoform X1 [Carcharodon carcharias]